MQNVYEINEPSQFGRLREIWSNLLERTTGADFFRTLDWLDVYWRFFGIGQRLRILGVAITKREDDDWTVVTINATSEIFTVVPS